jgi:hypothetical protein
MLENASSPPATDAYGTKTSHEAARLARCTGHAGLPRPFGDPLSGVVLVAEEGGVAHAGVVSALLRSLAAVKLDEAYVTWSSSPDLLEEILALEPVGLATVGTASQVIDSLGYPLARARFSEAPEGSWFAWTKGTFGLRLPALAPALNDADAKRRFWRAFLALRALAHDEEPGYRL